MTHSTIVAFKKII